MEDTLQSLQEWGTRFDAKVAALVAALDARLKRLQRSLMNAILLDFLDVLDTDGGRLAATATNAVKAEQLESLMDRFGRDESDADLKMFADQLLSIGEGVKGYYDLLDVPGEKLAVLESAMGMLRARIGLNKNGELVTDGYLYRLGRADEVRQNLKNYVVTAIASKTPLRDFTQGMKTLVVGNADTDGALQQYWRQYAYDTFNAAHEIVNLHMADGLGLQYFIYEGKNIATTRAFCRGKAGKVFSRKEADNWKNDPDLIEKSTKATYNPYVERGRYNCRHRINWISEALAKNLRPDL